MGRRESRAVVLFWGQKEEMMSASLHVMLLCGLWVGEETRGRRGAWLCSREGVWGASRGRACAWR